MALQTARTQRPPGSGMAETETSPLYTSLLLPLDGSSVSAQVLPYAVELARRLAVPVVLLRVLQAEPNEIAIDSRRREHDARQSQAEGYLEALRRVLQTSGVAIQTRIVEGPAVDSILGLQRQMPGSLLLITALGRSGLGPMGSIAEELSRKALGPVMLIKPARSAEA